MNRRPLILYIPGLLPKPAPDVHREQLLRCLLAGIERIDASAADEIRGDATSFDLVSWTYDFYGEHRDIGIDLPDIERLLGQPGPGESCEPGRTPCTGTSSFWITGKVTRPYTLMRR